jgi:hypothetical protein
MQRAKCLTLHARGFGVGQRGTPTVTYLQISRRCRPICHKLQGKGDATALKFCGFRVAFLLAQTDTNLDLTKCVKTTPGRTNRIYKRKSQK